VESEGWGLCTHLFCGVGFARLRELCYTWARWDKPAAPSIQRTALTMKRSRIAVSFLLILLCSGCATSKQPPDPMARYHPALQPEARAQLSQLGKLPRYDISVRIDPSAEAEVVGTQRVAIYHEGPDELTALYFRLYPNQMRYGGVMSIGGVTINGQTAAFNYASDNTAVHIALPQALPPESRADVDLSFELQVPQRDGGYLLLGESQGILTLPMFYPILAVRELHGGEPAWNLDIAPPAFGDVGYIQAGLYQVTATLPSDMVVAGTGAVITRTQSSQLANYDDLVLVGGPRREFMLIMSPLFQTVDMGACGARVTSYFLPEDRATGLVALQYAAAALRVYCDRFGPYPYREMEVVASPTRYFGMEYPGLNLIGVELYQQQKKDLEFLVVHEVAHQWWYSIVGNDQVNAAWLDEGLAEHSTYAYYEAVYGNDDAEWIWDQRWRAPYQYAVEQGLDTVVSQPLSGFTVINYETMTYAKAALFFDSVRRQVGDETYYRLLREYLARNRWGLAEPADFLTVAEEVSGQSLGELYRQWILTASTP